MRRASDDRQSLLGAFAALVLVVTAIAVFVAMGMAPGSIAKRRNHPWTPAVETAGWARLVFGFAGAQTC